MRSSRTFAAHISTLVIVLVSLTAGMVRADVTLPPFFSDHMVLQRDTKAAIWGTASPGEAVTCRFRDQEKHAEADKDGRWRVEFAGLKAGEPDELTVAGKNTIRFRDVLVGEVWVGSGQSNMAGAVRGYSTNDEVLKKLAAETHPGIRGCTAKGGWQVATPETNGQLSALLFAFAVRLNRELNVPVGMMLGAVGGTPSGAWISEAALEADPACQALIDEYAKTYDATLKDYRERILPAFEKREAATKAAGKTLGRPRSPAKPGTVNDQTAGYLYKAHILPMVGYGIRGVLWDQGEAGTAVGGVDQYTMMGALIRGWRDDWKAGDFPFIYVQKPSGGGCAWDNADPVTAKGEAFTELPDKQPGKIDTTLVAREGQSIETYVRIMGYKNVGMAISSDLGPNTHPTNKSGYGSRAAAVALGMVYARPVEYYGPVYQSYAIEGNKVRLTFTHVGRGLAMRHGEKLQGFVIAGEDRDFSWADAVIDGDTVVVSSPKVAKPAAVRYAWASKRPWANLFNKDGLPAVTFRTDAW